MEAAANRSRAEYNLQFPVRERLAGSLLIGEVAHRPVTCSQVWAMRRAR